MSKEAINELLFTDADGNKLEIASFPLALGDDSFCFDVINFKENVAYWIKHLTEIEAGK